jgi:hypothetical protein
LPRFDFGTCNECLQVVCDLGFFVQTRDKYFAGFVIREGHEVLEAAVRARAHLSTDIGEDTA